MSKYDDDTVKRNRAFYDMFASVYEKADGRRSEALWLKQLIKKIWMQQRTRFPNEPLRFLDLGAGTGFVAKIARDLFDEVYALDVSEKMLEQIDDLMIIKKVGNIYQTGYEDRFFHCVSTFAVLHHLGDLREAFREIHRILKSGGCYYSDHDLSAEFYCRHRHLIEFYRRLRNASGRYAEASNFNRDFTRKMFDACEVRKEGISKYDLKGLGDFFYWANINTFYHFQGIFPCPLKSIYPLGKGAIMRIIAWKEGLNVSDFGNACSNPDDLPSCPSD